MTEDEIEKQATAPAEEPIPGLGEAPGADSDTDDEDTGYVCMPADLVKE